MAQSAAEQYRKALEQAEAIKQGAVEEMKKNIQTQIDELNGFGFSYRLGSGGSIVGNGRRHQVMRPMAERECTICGVSGHDARAHRGQETKKKFTQKELAEKGLTPV